MSDSESELSPDDRKRVNDAVDKAIAAEKATGEDPFAFVRRELRAFPHLIPHAERELYYRSTSESASHSEDGSESEPPPNLDPFAMSVPRTPRQSIPRETQQSISRKIIQAEKKYSYNPDNPKDKLGGGGEGVVYAGRDETNDEDIAIKFLKRDLYRGAALKRLLKQVVGARLVNSPFVCRVNELVLPAKGPSFISMELVRGNKLSKHRGDKTFSASQILQIARELALGLKAIHEVDNLAHGDIKPSNVVLDTGYHPKIVDFGSMDAGTEVYFPPERQPLSTEGIRNRDIYAFGLTLLEVVTESTAAEIKDLRKRKDPGPYNLVRPNRDPVESTLEKTILRCIALNPAERPKSMAEVLAQLGVEQRPDDPPDVPTVSSTVKNPLRPLTAPKFGPSLACILLVLATLGAMIFPLINEQPVRPSLALNAQSPQAGDPAALLEQAKAFASRLSSGSTISTGKEYYGYEAQDLQSWPDDVNPPVKAPLVSFWYRREPVAIVPPDLLSSVRSDQPPLREQSVFVRIDPRNGQLLQAWTVPDAQPATQPATEPDVHPLDGLAPADAIRNRPINTTPIPDHRPSVAMPGSVRFSRIKLDPSNSGQTGRSWVVGAVAGGRTVYATSLQPPSAPTASSVSVPKLLAQFWSPLALLVGAILAALNYRQEQGTLRRASRIGLLVLAASFAGWLLLNWSAVLGFEGQADSARLVAGLGQSLMPAATVWVYYCACDHYLRKEWFSGRPLWAFDKLVASSSQGRIRDAIARSLLAGATAGALILLIVGSEPLASDMLGPVVQSLPSNNSASEWLAGLPTQRPAAISAELLRSYQPAAAAWKDVQSQIGWLLICLANATRLAFTHLATIVAVVYIVQSRVAAMIAYCLVMGAVFGCALAQWPATGIIAYSLALGILAWTMSRTGVLAVGIAIFVYFAATQLPLPIHNHQIIPTNIVGVGSIIALMLIAAAMYMDPARQRDR